MRDPDNELRIEALPELRQPGADRLVPWLERRRARRLAGRHVPLPDWDRRAVRRHRPGALLRLRLDAAAGLARRGRRAPDRLARERVPPRAARAWPQDAVLLLGSEPSLRWRTFCSLVTGPRPRPRRRARGHARLAARRRDAHAAGAGHRERERPRPRRAPRRPAVALRGPDRHRRRPARRLPRGRHPVGVALGGRAALRLDDRRRRRPRRRSATGSRP